MSVEKETDSEIGLMLRALKKYARLTPKDEYVQFEPTSAIGVDLLIQRKILHKLESEGAIKIGYSTTMGLPSSHLEPMGFEPQKYHLTLGDKFDEIYAVYVEPEAPVQVIGARQIRFDEKTGLLKIGVGECKVPQVNQYELAKHVFLLKPLGERVEEEDVIDDLRQRGEGNRTFFDTVRALNRLIEQDLGIAGLLKYERNGVRVRKELLK